MWTGLINSRPGDETCAHTHTHTADWNWYLLHFINSLQRPTWFYAHTESFVVHFGLDSRLRFLQIPGFGFGLGLGSDLALSRFPLLCLFIHLSLLHPGLVSAPLWAQGRERVRGHTAPPQPSDVTSLWKWHGCRFWIRGLLMACRGLQLVQRQYF